VARQVELVATPHGELIVLLRAVYALEICS